MKKKDNKFELEDSYFNNILNFSMLDFMNSISFLYLIDLKKKKNIALTRNEKFIDDYFFIDYDFLSRFIDKHK